MRNFPVEINRDHTRWLLLHWGARLASFPKRAIYCYPVIERTYQCKVKWTHPVPPSGGW